MRLNTFNREDYLYQKRLALIQKSQRPLQYRIQLINNQAVDEFILDYYDEGEFSIEKPYNESFLIRNIGQYNRLATNQSFQRLLDNSIIKQNHITRLEQIQASRKISDKITEVEVERIQKNLQYVEKVLNEAELNLEKYNTLVQKLPRQVSRQDMLEEALTRKENYKGRRYTYRELDKLSMDLEKYKHNHQKYETAKIENNQAQREGLGSLNQTKTWVWSELEDTRHHGMDGETVGLYEKFVVINEQNGDEDLLRFPHDIMNDHNNCSNLCNCGCSYKIS